MKRLLSFLLVLVFVLYPSQVVLANPAYVRITSDTYARVLGVVDGDALRVQPVGTNQVALVRLAGINTVDIRQAQDFMAGALIGRTVEVLLSEATTPSVRFSERWVPVYLVNGDITYNRSLVQRGLAYVDPDYQGHWMFDTLMQDSFWAYQARVGIWDEIGFRTQFVPHRRGEMDDWFFGMGIDDRVNVNTASISQINSVLFNLHSEAGADIVNNRNTYGAFRHVSDLRYVLQREDFEMGRRWFKVSTNVNTASETELTQLRDVTTAMAREIVLFREANELTDLNQLVEAGILTSAILSRNQAFISLSYVDEVDGQSRRGQDRRIYVNFATVEEWMALPGGMPRSFALELVREAQRYPFRRWNDLRDFFARYGHESIFDSVRQFLIIDFD